MNDHIYLYATIRRSCLLPVAALAVGCWLQANAIAATPWPEQIEAAKAAYHPIGDEDVSLALKGLGESMARVHVYTGRNTPVGKRWKEYLQWENQQQQLKKGLQQDVDFWREILRLIAIDSDGLANESFIEYRGAIRTLIDVVETRQVADLQTEYVAALDQLAAALPAAPEKLTSQQAEKISEIFTLLQRRRQAKELVQSVCETFSRPNVVIAAPVDLAISYLAGESTKTVPVRDVVAGAVVTGSARITTKQEVSVSEGENGIKLELKISGTSKSDTESYSRGVTVNSTGELKFDSKAILKINGKGLSVSPFATQAAFRSDNYDVSTCYRGIRNFIALRRACNRRAAAECEATGNAVGQLNVGFKEALNKRLDPWVEGYNSDFRRPLLCRDLFPSNAKFGVRNNKIEAEYFFDCGFQMAAPGGPAYTAPQDALALSIHQSAFNNSLQEAYSKRRMLLTQFFGELFAAEENADEQEASELSIHFVQREPLRLSFDKQQVTLALKASQFELKGQQYAAMEIQLKYRLENENGKWVLTSLPPEILTPRRPDGTRSKLGIRNYSLRRILIKSIELHQPERLLASDFLASLTKADSFELADFQLQNGWVHFGLRTMEKTDKLASTRIGQFP